jgi:hypothetical protein
MLVSVAVFAQEAPATATFGAGASVVSGCTVTTTILKGKTDNFASPADPTWAGPALTQYLSTRNPVGFDVDQVNHYVGQSFPVCACETCSAKLEIRVRIAAQKDTYPNDSYVIGLAPFNPNQIAATAHIWDDGNLNPKTVTVDLDPKKLSQLLCANKSQWLDVIVQDDTVVDWMRLTITHP